jgi:hypothetical protein
MTNAVTKFLAEMQDHHDIDENQKERRRRLFALTEQNPDMVLAYLDSLPAGVEQRNELLQMLRKIILEGKFPKKPTED